MYSLHYGPKKYEHSFLSWLQVMEVGAKSLLAILRNKEVFDFVDCSIICPFYGQVVRSRQMLLVKSTPRAMQRNLSYLI